MTHETREYMGLSASTIKLLDYVQPRIRGRFEGMSDDEYLWEPVPGCWSVRESNGTWLADQTRPAPEPSAPMTSRISGQSAG